MKHFSKFSSFMRVLAMVLTIVLVAGMVGTNKADADDNSSNVAGESSLLKITAQPGNYSYLNKGSEGTNFKPSFSASFEALELDSPHYLLVTQWQYRLVGREDDAWTNIGDPQSTNTNQPRTNVNGRNVYGIKFTSTLNVTGDILRNARDGRYEFRCTAELSSCDPSDDPIVYKPVDSKETTAATFDYKSEVVLRDKNARNQPVLKTVTVPYGKTLEIPEELVPENKTVTIYKLDGHNYVEATANDLAITYGKTLYLSIVDKPYISILTPPVNYEFNNAGNEWGFSPEFSLTAKVNNLEYSRGYYVIFNWQELKDGAWVDSPISSGNSNPIVSSQKLYSAQDYASYNGWKTLSYTLPLNTPGEEGGYQVAREGREFRCRVLIVNNVKTVNGVYTYDIVAESAFTNPVKCVYTSTVTFVDRSNTNIKKEVSVAYGETANLPSEFQADGKVAVWYAHSYGSELFNQNTPITKATRIYISYKNVYDVEFVMGGHGDAIETQHIVAGEKATQPDDPSEDGWKFEGWYSENGNTKFDFANTPITKNTKVYARWSEIIPTFDVTFTHITSQSTPTHHGLNDKVVSVKKGDKVAEPDPAPSCNSHVFLGWYSDPSLEEKYKFEFDKTDINQSITLYGKWGVKVSFKTNVAGISFNDQILAIGDTVSPLTLDSNTYRITGVYTNESYGDRYKYNYPAITKNNSNFTLYVKLEKIEYVTVTFWAVKGNSVEKISSTSIEKGKTVTLPEAPKFEGWTLQGWYSDQACKNAFVAGTTFDKNADIFAKYTQDTFTVSFVNVRNNNVEPQTVAYQGYATQPTTDPTDSNYKFVGWFTSEHGNTEFKFNDMQITKDTKVYAHWTPKVSYKVSFEMNGHGTQVTSQTVKEGDKASRPLQDPTATNYRFDGWYEEDLETLFNFDQPINGNTTVYAKWTQTHVTVTFYSEDGKETRHGYKNGVIKTITVPMNGTIPADKIPSPTCANNSRFNGYRHEFEGWYSDEKCTDSFVFTAGLDKDTPVYSKWYTEYKVTFNGNGKIDQNVSAQWVKSGEKATEPMGITAKVDTEEFIGWFADNSNTAFDFTKPITKAVELKARTQVAEKTYNLKDDGVKKNYVVDNQLDVDKLYIVVTQGSAVTEVPVTANMVSGFDSSKAYDKLTLTVSYDNHTFTYDVVVGRKDGAISVDVEAIELVYGDQITQTDLGVDSHGDTVVITSNDPAVTIVDGKIVAAGVGEATLTLTAPQTDTHEAASTDVTVKVTAKEVELVWSNVDPVEYDGQTHKPSAVVKTEDLVGSDTVTITVSGEGTNAGKYTATASIDGNANYVIKEGSDEVEFEITKKKLDALAISFDKLLCGDVSAFIEDVLIVVPDEPGFIVPINVPINEPDVAIIPINELGTDRAASSLLMMLRNRNISNSEPLAVNPILTNTNIPSIEPNPVVGGAPELVRIWPNMKTGETVETSVNPMRLYELTLDEIKDLFENYEPNGKVPTPYTEAVVGGKTYVLEVKIDYSKNVEYPTEKPFVVTIDGKEAKCYVGTTEYATWLFVEFTAEHVAGEAKVENKVDAQCLVDGHYDSIVRCTKCGAVLEDKSERNITIPQTGHDWDDWKIVEDATYAKAGKMVRVCKNDSEHKEEKEIPQLTNEIVKMQIVIPDTVKKEYKIGEKLNIDGLKIEFTWKDGSKTEIPVTVDMVTGFDSMKATDAQELTVKYKDADGAYTIKVKKDTSIFYTITGSLVWVRGTNMNPIVHRNVDDWITFSLFKGFKIGGKVPPVSAYIAKSGSLDLTIMNEYLETLEPGEYDLTIEFEDGEVSAKITVPEATKKEEEKPVDDQPVEPKKEESKTPESPKTADTAQTFVWTILLAIAVAAMIAVVVYRRRREDAE